jgi:hypothetical protein
MVQRGGPVRSKVLPTVNGHNLKQAIRDNVQICSEVILCSSLVLLCFKNQTVSDFLLEKSLSFSMGLTYLIKRSQSCQNPKQRSRATCHLGQMSRFNSLFHQMKHCAVVPLIACQLAVRSQLKPA